MLVHFGHDLLVAEWDSSVVCIGTFDGVHLGHRELVRETVKRSRESERPGIVLTFDRHPASTLAPDRAPEPISTLEQNLDIFRSLGVSGCLVLPFDHALSITSAEDFFETVLIGKLRAKSVVVGHDFAFGAGREGTTDWLKKRIETTVIPPFELQGRRVSSSDIRSAIVSGDLERATRALGRPFMIEGVVVSGQKLGRTLGYPTVNLARSRAQVSLPDGVYGGLAHTDEGVYLAAISLGSRPSIEGAGRSIEAYLLDYPGANLYGTSLRLEIWEFLRGQITFGDLQDLKEQMSRDVDCVARWSNLMMEPMNEKRLLGGLWAKR